MTNELKPGYLTTEFWQALIAQVTAIAVLLGVLAPDEAESLGEALVQIAGAVLVMVAQVAIVWKYLASRTAVKEAAIAVDAELLKEHLEAPPDAA